MRRSGSWCRVRIAAARTSWTSSRTRAISSRCATSSARTLFCSSTEAAPVTFSIFLNILIFTDVFGSILVKLLVSPAFCHVRFGSGVFLGRRPGTRRPGGAPEGVARRQLPDEEALAHQPPASETPRCRHGAGRQTVAARSAHPRPPPPQRTRRGPTQDRQRHEATRRQRRSGPSERPSQAGPGTEIQHAGSEEPCPPPGSPPKH